MDSVAVMTGLVKKLASQKMLAQHDTREETEAERLAHALCDMKESFETYLNVLFPKLINASDEEIADCLYEIGDEVRHIAYHLQDSKFLALYAERFRE